MFGFDPSDFIPYMIFAIPIIAIVGGITLAIVRTLGRQRLIELAQQERIAAIQRGIEPSKLPALPLMADDDDLTPGISPAERDRRRSQGLLIGGVVTFAAGAGLSSFLAVIQSGERAWAVGLIPIMIGLSLLLSAWIVAPKGGQR
jgi:uncharacterized protein DUF6249